MQYDSPKNVPKGGLLFHCNVMPSKIILLELLVLSGLKKKNMYMKKKYKKAKQEYTGHSSVLSPHG